MSAAGLSLVIQLASTVVLARLLKPADFGVVTMVTTFSLLAGNFGLNGFTEAILQREQVNPGLASNLFWINLVAGILIAAGFAACGPLLAHFYHDPVVARVAAGIAVSMAVASPSVLHLALLKRAMRFTTVSAITLVGRGTMVVSSVLLALAGWGYWALVAGYVAQQATTTVASWWACRWLPTLPQPGQGTSASVRFAVNVYARFAFNYFANNSDNLLVGWRFNAQALGFYKKAYDLFALPGSQLVSPISAVIVAALSRFSHDRAQFRRFFLNGMAVLAFLGMGVGADFTLCGMDLIRFLLGPGWGEAGRIFAFLGPGIGVMLLYSTYGWVHLSIGRPDRWLRWSVVEFVITFCLLVAGLHFGPQGVAMAWTVSYFTLMVPAFWYAGKPIGLGVADMLSAVWRFFAASLLAGAATYVIVGRVPWFLGAGGAAGALARVACTSFVLGALYAVAVIALHQGLAPFRQVSGLLRELLPRRAVIASGSNRVAPAPIEG